MLRSITLNHLTPWIIDYRTNTLLWAEHVFGGFEAAFKIDEMQEFTIYTELFMTYENLTFHFFIITWMCFTAVAYRNIQNKFYLFILSYKRYLSESFKRNKDQIFALISNSNSDDCTSLKNETIANLNAVKSFSRAILVSKDRLLTLLNEAKLLTLKSTQDEVEGYIKDLNDEKKGLIGRILLKSTIMSAFFFF